MAHGIIRSGDLKGQQHVEVDLFARLTAEIIVHYTNELINAGEADPLLWDKIRNYFWQGYGLRLPIDILKATPIQVVDR